MTDTDHGPPCKRCGQPLGVHYLFLPGQVPPGHERGQFDADEPDRYCSPSAGRPRTL